MRRTFKTTASAIAVAASIVFASINAACTADEQPRSDESETIASECIVKNRTHDRSDFDMCVAAEGTQITEGVSVTGEELWIYNDPQATQVVNRSEDCPNDDESCAEPIEIGDIFQAVCVTTNPETSEVMIGVVIEQQFFKRSDYYVVTEFFTTGQYDSNMRGFHAHAAIGFVPETGIDSEPNYGLDLMRSYQFGTYGDDFPVDDSCQFIEIALNNQEKTFWHAGTYE